MFLDTNLLKEYMQRCIELAKKAPKGLNKPYVGALVLSADGILLGEGYRSFLRKTFVYHAERMALVSAGHCRARNGILITTLEPCIEVKKNQVFKPCSELIAEIGIDTVIIGLLENSHDINNGSGINYLKKRGINVVLYADFASVIQEDLMPTQYEKKLWRCLKEIIG